MRRLRPTAPAVTNSLIGVVELAAGLAGLAGVVVASVREPALLAGLAAWGGALLFALTAGAGLLVLRARRRGAELSVVVQALQVFQGVDGHHAFRFVAGPHLTLPLVGSRLGSAAGIASSFSISAGPGLPSFGLSVNLVALVLAVYLVWMLRWTARRPSDETAG